MEKNKQKPIWTDYYLKQYKWYRKYRKCVWYKHQFTNDALEICVTFTGTWWALYGKINRYSNVVDMENYKKALAKYLKPKFCFRRLA